MSGNQNHDDASSRSPIKTCDNHGVTPWSDVNHDVLFLVMMKIGAIDFIAFSGVCKSWRSLAISNKNKFMSSKQPMSIFIPNNNECRLTDREGRNFKTIIARCTRKTFVGLTCGYLILFSNNTREIWLVNPVKRHQLHFPSIPFHGTFAREYFRAILVFLPSTSEWVLVVLIRNGSKIWFCKAGQRDWTKLSAEYYIQDLISFKGKIYALYNGIKLSEVTLYPTPKVTDLKIMNFQKPEFNHLALVTSGESLYVMKLNTKTAFKIIINSKVEGEVSLEKIEDEFAIFYNNSNQTASFILDTGHNIFYAKMWYLFHDCLSVNLLNE